MINVADLLVLPISTLIVLAAGYMAYRVAFVGHDGAHTTADIVFLSFTFSAIASVILWLFGTWFVIGAPVSTGITLAAAVLWRTRIHPWLWQKLRSNGISDHDRGRNVWESMLMRPLNAPTRLVVTLKSGRQLMCADARSFDFAPLGPCLLGPDGSVALYVTDERQDATKPWNLRKPYEAENMPGGYEMTYVPAAEIARVAITRPS